MHYLEAGVGALAGGDVLARAGDRDNRDVVVVATEELLAARDDVTHHNRGSQGEEDVFVVRVESEALIDLACRKKCQMLLHLPWKPMTAESSSSCSIVAFVVLEKFYVLFV